MKNRLHIIPQLILAVLMGTVPASCGQKDKAVAINDSLPWSVRIAESFLLRHPGAVTSDSASPAREWNYEQGLMLIALRRMEQHTGDKRYLSFVKENIDHYVAEDGSIRTYNRTAYNLDNIAPGRVLLSLYDATHDGKYRRAADTLRQQLREQPRTKSGGFWHKKIYPYQMWLDGLFMAEPFYAAYAVMSGDTAAYGDIVRQFRLMTLHTAETRSGLLYHGWDESHTQAWADSMTGRSRSLWARSIGWYAMALVDVLSLLPQGIEGRGELEVMLRNVSRGIAAVQDTTSGLWYQVIDAGDKPGNYFEASASAMFAYVFARGVHLGILDTTYLEKARHAFTGITRHLVTVEPSGFVNLEHTCKAAGLGGTPYRDGRYAYYIREPQRTNDLKGLGAWLLAAIELESQESVR